jgi:hypothetical protein
MMKLSFTFLVLTFITAIVSVNAQTILAAGEQPQFTVDSKGLVRLIFGSGDKIYFSTSDDQGKTFSPPVTIGEVPEMHLGMTRGPQIATSRDYSVVTAIDKKGNIHSFIQNQTSGKWEKIGNVNDVDASAPEGLMSITADENNNFYAVWLDLREDRKNNICFASLKGSKWSPNKFVYRSPENHVCECCKPSVVAKGQTISIMFRNWLHGSRDLYLVTSENNGKSFSDEQKLGKGTWPLKGCPMDGGGLSIDSKNQIHTAWQRDGIVYYAVPGLPEQRIGEGRHVGLDGPIITWENGSDIMMKRIDGAVRKLGEGTNLRVFEMNDKSMLAVWEMNGQIVFKKI